VRYCAFAINLISFMSEHRATVSWKNLGPDFLKGKYTREHRWTFDGGAVVVASAAPANVRPPYSNPSGVDPEEAFVAAIASCHMLTYLYVAYQKGFEVESYEDPAVGIMTKNDNGIPWVSSVTLDPRITYRGERLPSGQDEEDLHHLAHEQCFIANSIKTQVKVQRGPADQQPKSR
jgi:organic hydroperoxide reductase OsmC/OhrA